MSLIRLEEIGFEIFQPDGWESLCLEEARENLRNSLEGTKIGLSEFARSPVPVIYLRWPHHDPLQVTPSAQVKLRLRQETTLMDRTRFIEWSIQNLKRAHWAMEMIEANDTFLLGGVPGILLHYQAELLTEDGKPIPFVSRTFSVVTNDLFYTIGLAGPPAGPFARAEDLRAIERSIRITPDWM